jgi:nucleoside-diphosphate-sugar epimerase
MTDAIPLLPEADLNYMYDGLSKSEWNFFQNKRIFISGGSGFIGKWMLSALLEAEKRLLLKSQIEILTRCPSNFIDTVPQIACARNVTLRQGDIKNFEFPSGKFDIVVHAATDVVAQNSPAETFLTCVDGTRHILDFAKISGATDFLLTSSGAIYGRHPDTAGGVLEEYEGGPDPTLPNSAYGEGKRVSEMMACIKAVETGLKVKIARIYAQVGPYLPLDKHFAIGNFIKDVLEGREIVIRGDGTPYRSYMHSADTAVWLWAMVVRGSSGRAWNVGGSEELTIAELATRVAQLLDSKKGIRVMKQATPGQIVERYVPNINRAITELKLPVPIPINDAILRTAQWIKQKNMV